MLTLIDGNDSFDDESVIYIVEILKTCLHLEKIELYFYDTGITQTSLNRLAKLIKTAIPKIRYFELHFPYGLNAEPFNEIIK